MNVPMIRKILEHQKLYEFGATVRRKGYVQDRNNPQTREMCWKAGSAIMDLHGWLEEALTEIEWLRAMLRAQADDQPDGDLLWAKTAAQDLIKLGVAYEHKIDYVSRIAFQGRTAMFRLIEMLEAD